MKKLALVFLIIMVMIMVSGAQFAQAEQRKPGEPIVEKGFQPAKFEPAIPAFYGWVPNEWISETGSLIKPIDKPLEVYMSCGKHNGRFIYNWKRARLPEKSMVLFKHGRPTHLPYVGCLVYPASEGLARSPEGGYVPRNYDPEFPAFTGNPPKSFLITEDLVLKPLKEDTPFFVSQKLKNGMLTWEWKVLKKGTMMVSKGGTFTHKDNCGNLVYPAKDWLKPVFGLGYAKLSGRVDRLESKVDIIKSDVAEMKDDISDMREKVTELNNREDKQAPGWLKTVAILALVLAVILALIRFIPWLIGILSNGEQPEPGDEEVPEEETEKPE